MQNKSLIAVCALLAGLCHGDAAFADQTLAASGNAFAFKRLEQIAKDQPHANVSISPYSACRWLCTAA